MRRERSEDPSRTREEPEEPGSIQPQPAVRHSRLPSKETWFSWKHGEDLPQRIYITLLPSAWILHFNFLIFFSFFFGTPPSPATLVC